MESKKVSKTLKKVFESMGLPVEMQGIKKDEYAISSSFNYEGKRIIAHARYNKKTEITTLNANFIDPFDMRDSHLVYVRINRMNAHMKDNFKVSIKSSGHLFISAVLNCTSQVQYQKQLKSTLHRLLNYGSVTYFFIDGALKHKDVFFH